MKGGQVKDYNHGNCFLHSSGLHGIWKALLKNSWSLTNTCVSLAYLPRRLGGTKWSHSPHLDSKNIFVPNHAQDLLWLQYYSAVYVRSPSGCVVMINELVLGVKTSRVWQTDKQPVLSSLPVACPWRRECVNLFCYLTISEYRKCHVLEYNGFYCAP